MAAGLGERTKIFIRGQKSGTIQFIIKPGNGAKKVQLAGDFTDWRPVEMRKQKSGAFAATVPVPPGNHEYKFILEGQWIVDPDNRDWACNPFGTLNSVAHI
jgi:1,4-alpha-glucan branching enzyme